MQSGFEFVQINAMFFAVAHERRPMVDISATSRVHPHDVARVQYGTCVRQCQNQCGAPADGHVDQNSGGVVHVPVVQPHLAADDVKRFAPPRVPAPLPHDVCGVANVPLGNGVHPDLSRASSGLAHCVGAYVYSDIAGTMRRHLVQVASSPAADVQHAHRPAADGVNGALQRNALDGIVATASCGGVVWIWGPPGGACVSTARSAGCRRHTQSSPSIVPHIPAPHTFTAVAFAWRDLPRRFVAMADCAPAVPGVAWVLLGRSDLLSRPCPAYVGQLAVLCALQVAHKVLDDEPHSNAWVASMWSDLLPHAPCVLVRDVNAMESRLLLGLSWRAHVTASQYPTMV